jgi:septal ring factor EnvC (AmiA/AmiB activator)
VEESKRQLKKLEEARANLARQIEESKAALAELDERIRQLKFDLAQQENTHADQL